MKWAPRTDEQENETGHSSRPWVYFMVDCFFLITIFFVCTFKVRKDELNVAGRLPPGGPTHCRLPLDSIVRTMNVHVSRNADAPSYTFLTRRGDLSALNEMLANVAESGGTAIRISYERDVPFTDVLAIFNACSRNNIMHCGLVPLRTE